MLTRHIRKSLQVTPGPFPDFWVGPGDEATSTPPDVLSSLLLLLLLLLTYPSFSPLSSTPPDVLPSPSFPFLPHPISPVSSSYMCTTLPDKWSLSQSQQDGDKAITNSYELLSLPHQPRLGTLLNVEGKQVLCYCNIVAIELLEKEDRVWSRERE